MKLLIDQNISNRIINRVIDYFSEIKHVKDFGLNDSNDIDIWKFARENNYAILTFDGDFYEMCLIYGIPPKIIWLRTGNIKTNSLADILISNSLRINNFLNNPENKDIGCLEIL